MKKIYTLVLTVFLFNTIGAAQSIENYNAADRRIEILAYSSVELVPNDFYISFILKEYINNGKTVTIKETIESIKKISLELGCDLADLQLGNIYGYVDSKEDGSGIFREKSKYILRLDKLECLEQFLSKINKLALESVNIDEINVKFSDVIVRDMQRNAFNDAKAKADVFLAIFNEKCGKVLDIQEINATLTQPTAKGDISTKKSIMISEGIQYYKTISSNTKMVKYEYEAKVVFEIK